MPPTQEKKITISKEKFLKDADNSREVDLNLVHLTMMLRNTTNSRKVGHNLQRKVLKDAANSGKEDHNLQRKLLKMPPTQEKKITISKEKS